MTELNRSTEPEEDQGSQLSDGLPINQPKNHQPTRPLDNHQPSPNPDGSQPPQQSTESLSIEPEYDNRGYDHYLYLLNRLNPAFIERIRNSLPLGRSDEEKYRHVVYGSGFTFYDEDISIKVSTSPGDTHINFRRLLRDRYYNFNTQKLALSFSGTSDTIITVQLTPSANELLITCSSYRAQQLQGIEQLAVDTAGEAAQLTQIEKNVPGLSQQTLQTIIREYREFVQKDAAVLKSQLLELHLQLQQKAAARSSE